MMTIEQKAQAYDEAVKEAFIAYKDEDKHLKATLERIFPELKENDELTWLTRYIEEEAYSLSMDIRDNEDRIKLEKLKKSLNWLKKQGEQRSVEDRVEPKFKVGDWILYSGDHYEGVRHITKIDENGYYIERNGLPHGIIPFNHEICMRMWTIQDAKNGDVLAAHECIVLFKEIDGLNIKCHCTYHFMNNPSFYANTLQNKSAFHPATKEQCEQLEKAISDAGYIFDFEKKELKKVVQNHAWSEEDGEITNKLIAVVELYYYDNGDDSLDKQRCHSWLKSLKDRYAWKPSEEQMHAFEQVYDWYNNNFAPSETLTSLYNDLIKL